MKQYNELTFIGKCNLLISDQLASHINVINCDIDNAQEITDHRDVQRLEVKITTVDFANLAESIKNSPEAWSQFTDSIATNIEGVLKTLGMLSDDERADVFAQLAVDRVSHNPDLTDEQKKLIY